MLDRPENLQSSPQWKTSHEFNVAYTCWIGRDRPVFNSNVVGKVQGGQPTNQPKVNFRRLLTPRAFFFQILFIYFWNIYDAQKFQGMFFQHGLPDIRIRPWSLETGNARNTAESGGTGMGSHRPGKWPKMEACGCQENGPCLPKECSCLSLSLQIFYKGGHEIWEFVQENNGWK